VSLLAAAVLIAANVAIAVRGAAGDLAPLARSDPYSYYWTVVFGLLLPVLPFALWRTRHAPLEERRRVAIFASGLALAGILPVLVAALPPFVPALRRFTTSGSFLIPFNLLMIFGVAAIATYSVVVERVLDVRTVLRMAAQYWLATAVVAAMAVLPFVLLLRLLYQERGEPLARLLFGSRGLPILAMSIAGVTLLRLRRPAMLVVDRIFFREPYDPQRILSALTTQARADASTGQLAQSVLDQVGEAIHPESVGILVDSVADGAFVPVASALRSLPRTSTLSARLLQHGAPLPVDLARPVELLEGVPDEDRIWLGDAGASMLVPLVGSAGELEGILALGPKRSELPYSREDQVLLHAVAGAAGIGLENRRLRSGGAGTRAANDESRASECVACGCVSAAQAPSCPECAGAMREAALPQNLFGKFSLERRIGKGGMGVVYGAMDVALARRVALKTLPRTSPEDAERLRREARAMAAVTHLNLALILGAETWRGTPILVLEYLAGGTLESRLAAGPLPMRSALEIAHCVARVLERLHASGLLHRDVKPSNVGFSDAEEPKLLDFGLVQILRDVVPERPDAVPAPIGETGFAGTPLYMSPEALESGRPDPGFDLWSLAVVAFEALTGKHPFERHSATATLAAIRTGWTDAMRTLLPAEAQPCAEFFESALAGERNQRPGTAGELAERLQKVLDACA
jgi:hypothetical protein